MRKNIYIFVFLLLLLATGYGIYLFISKYMNVGNNGQQYIEETNTQEGVTYALIEIYEGYELCLENTNTCFELALARNDLERMNGLSNTKALKDTLGMLFVFPSQGASGFWMKDMNYALDIVFLDKELKVVDIAHNQQPCTQDFNCEVYIPKSVYMYVLEINGGLSEKFGINVGSKFTTSDSLQKILF